MTDRLKTLLGEVLSLSREDQRNLARLLTVNAENNQIRDGEAIYLGQKTQATPMSEIIFVVEEAPEGGFIAKALGSDIFTQAESLDDLHAHVRDAVQCHFEREHAPTMIRLHFIRDEVIAL
jgi:hypothetical protein